jgi:hypothetical protein
MAKVTAAAEKGKLKQEANKVLEANEAAQAGGQQQHKTL